MTTEIEQGGRVHAIRVTARKVDGIEALRVQFWGGRDRNGWLSAGFVLGRDDGAEDVALQQGLSASVDYLGAR